MIEHASQFLIWLHAQPTLVQLYVDYVLVRSIAIKFVSDETKRWLVEPVWFLVKTGLRFLFRPAFMWGRNWYAHRDLSSTDLL
jgi:hypothetical protein